MPRSKKEAKQLMKGRDGHAAGCGCPGCKDDAMEFTSAQMLKATLDPEGTIRWGKEGRGLERGGGVPQNLSLGGGG
jgi:hypothetical protein